MDTALNNSSIQNTPNIDHDFAKTVEESKAKIHEAAFVETKKRGRGRPSKTAQAPIGATSTQSPTGISGPALQSGVSAPVDVAPYLCHPIIALSKIPAHRHQIPELAFTEDEAKACATALNECLKAFIPDVNQMSPKTAAILGAFVTFGSIGFTKYQIYLEKKPKEMPKPEPEIQKINSDLPKYDAQDYFRK